MTSSLLLCLTALLVIYSTAHAAGNINCRKFVYHPKCRGVAAKRSDLPNLAAHRRPDVDRKQAFHPLCRGAQVKRVAGRHHLHNTTPRKSEDELSLIDQEYLPMEDTLQSLQPLQPLQPLPRHPPGPALWSYLADRPANLLLAHRKPDSDTLELAYDYE